MKANADFRMPGVMPRLARNAGGARDHMVTLRPCSPRSSRTVTSVAVRSMCPGAARALVQFHGDRVSTSDSELGIGYVRVAVAVKVNRDLRAARN